MSEITETTTPPFLLEWEPMQHEELPLQVALMTMELCAIRDRLTALEAAATAPETRPAPEPEPPEPEPEPEPERHERSHHRHGSGTGAGAGRNG